MRTIPTNPDPGVCRFDHPSPIDAGVVRDDALCASTDHASDNVHKFGELWIDRMTRINGKLFCSSFSNHFLIPASSQRNQRGHLQRNISTADHWIEQVLLSNENFAGTFGRRGVGFRSLPQHFIEPFDCKR